MADENDTSNANTLPTDEPQAPCSIPVEQVDDGNTPLNPGGEPHGNRGCGGMAGEPG